MYRDEVLKVLDEIIESHKEKKGVLPLYRLYRLRLYRFWVASSYSGFEYSNWDTVSREIWLLGALLGFSIFVVIEIIQLESIDRALGFSLFMFACAIPLIVMDLVLDIFFEQMRLKYTIRTPFMTCVYFFMMVFVILGVFGLFWHYSFLVAALFIALVFLSLFILVLYLDFKRLVNEIIDKSGK